MKTWLSLSTINRTVTNVKASNGDSPTTGANGVADSVPIGRFIVRLEVLRKLVQDL